MGWEGERISDFRERKWQYKLLLSIREKEKKVKKKNKEKPAFLHRAGKALFCSLYERTLVNNANTTWAEQNTKL